MKNVVRMAGEATTGTDLSVEGEGIREGSLPGQAALPRSTPPVLGQIKEVSETLPVMLLLLVLCGLDWALYSIFDTIRHHSFLQYSFRSEPTPPGDTPLENSHLTPILPILSPHSGSQSLPALIRVKSEPCNLTAVTGAFSFQPLYIYNKKGSAFSEGMECAVEKYFYA